MINKYVTMQEAIKVLGFCRRTLQVYANNNKIETIRTTGGHRRFNINKYIEDNNIKIREEDNKLSIIYCRVSSEDKIDDLEKQINYLKNKYGDTCEVITDIGSSLHCDRKGIKRIMDLAIDNKIDKLIVTHKDRLSRFGFEGLSYMLKVCSKATIIVDDLDIKCSNTEKIEELIEIITLLKIKSNK